MTAVLVAHDGSAWLPETLAGFLAQERPAQNVVAADTGSADASARLLADALGADRVLHLARRTGFGAAVDEAARSAGVPTPDELTYLRRPSGWDPATRTWSDAAYDMPELPYGEPVQWLWLLHDDSAPEPAALGELLRVVDADDQAVIAGPKLRGWYDRGQLLEVGVSIAPSGRRWTGLDRREPDQGQHDQVRAVLSVSTAGMLIRRDVFDALGGFDQRLPLMRDDLDLCWRAHAAGHRVLIAPDAVLRHAEAASRERRTVDCAGRTAARPYRVAKAGAVYTLLVNTRTGALPYTLLRITLGTLLRTLANVVGKAPRHAVDELAGLLAVLLRPVRVLKARRERRGTAVRAADKGALRPLFPPPGATVRVTADRLLGRLPSARRAEPGPAPAPVPPPKSAADGDQDSDAEPHPAGPSPYPDPVADRFPRLRRTARRPGPALLGVLVLVTLVACRDLLGSGALAGGALLPAPEDPSGLWSRYADQWHAVGIGGTPTAPPYLGLVAALATVLSGSPELAVTVLLIGSVPLAGLTAYLASGALVASRPLRAWASVTYALLPATTGAIASGRLGTAVLAILLPPLARAAVAAHHLARRSGSAPGGPVPGSRRAVWTYALLLTAATAFTPVVWPLAAVLGIAAVAVKAASGTGPAAAVRCAAALLTPAVLLAPWSLTPLTEPSAVLREAGLDTGAADGGATAFGLLTLGPGGPGGEGAVLLLGLVVAALAALLRAERRFAVRTAWTVALTGFLTAALVNGSYGAGPATLVQGAGLIAAACLAAELGRTRVSARDFGWRQPVAVLVAAVAALAPVQLAAGWLADGADGPLERRDPVQVPAYVAEQSTNRDQPRTLVIGGGTSPGRVPYALVRGSGARLGDAELTRADGGDPRLDRLVARLVAGTGADHTAELSGYAVRYVLVRDGAPESTVRVLDSGPGLTRLSRIDGSTLWEVDRQVARITVIDGTAEPLPVAAGPVEARAQVPAGGDGRVLRLADRADDGWRAALNGRPLPKRTVDGWAQGFELPAEGGLLEVSYEEDALHTAWQRTRPALLLVLIVLALPGRRRHVDDDLPEAVAVLPSPGPGPADQSGPAVGNGPTAPAASPAPGRSGTSGVGATPPGGTPPYGDTPSTAIALPAQAGPRGRADAPGPGPVPNSEATRADTAPLHPAAAPDGPAATGHDTPAPAGLPEQADAQGPNGSPAPGALPVHPAPGAPVRRPGAAEALRRPRHHDNATRGESE
ncbi:glycosyltransferase [Streptomyces sp. NPDC006798]|uniref:glycosyltransferase n=1 Tax=Streptomyces sp. NPDC006798 TaxID=3155462 RepID=UPI0033D1FE88